MKTRGALWRYSLEAIRARRTPIPLTWKIAIMLTGTASIGAITLFVMIFGFEVRWGQLLARTLMATLAVAALAVILAVFTKWRLRRRNPREDR